MKSLTVLFLSLVVLISCQTNKPINAEKKLSSSNGGSIVTAKILAISDQRSTKYPCSDVPCIAIVQIEKVNEMTGRMSYPPISGKEGEMKFIFTLNETSEKLFPNLTKRYPGLKVGDRFKAEVIEELLLENGQARWVVYDYILLH